MDAQTSVEVNMTSTGVVRYTVDADGIVHPRLYMLVGVVVEGERRLFVVSGLAPSDHVIDTDMDTIQDDVSVESRDAEAAQMLVEIRSREGDDEGVEEKEEDSEEKEERKEKEEESKTSEWEIVTGED